jgi:hypothetical protein
MVDSIYEKLMDMRLDNVRNEEVVWAEKRKGLLGVDKETVEEREPNHEGPLNESTEAHSQVLQYLQINEVL